MSKLNFFLHTLVGLATSFLISINPIQSALQFGISCLSLSSFFPIHQYTAICNNVKGYPHFDIYTAVVSTAVAFFMILPAIYVLGRMITPTCDEHLLKLMKNDYFSKRDQNYKARKQHILLVAMKYSISIFAVDVFLMYGISHWLRSFAKAIQPKLHRKHLIYIQDKVDDASRRINFVADQTEEEVRIWRDSCSEKLPHLIDLFREEFFEAKHFKLIALEIDDDDDEKESVTVVDKPYTYILKAVRTIVYIITLIEVFTGLSHLTTSTGRECFAAIYLAYKNWLLSLLGYWDSNGVLFNLFKIEQTVQELNFRKVEKQSDKSMNPETMNPLAARKNRQTSEEKKYVTSRRYMQFYSSVTTSTTEDDYTCVIQSKLGTKAILLQLVPVFNILSVLLISTCGSPLFCRDKYLISKLNDLIPLPTKTWESMVENEMRINKMTRDELYSIYQYKWRLNLYWLQNLYTQSRVMTYVVSALPVILATAILFSSEIILKWVTVLVAVILIPYNMMSDIRIIIAVANILSLTDDDFSIFFRVVTCSGYTCR